MRVHALLTLTLMVVLQLPPAFGDAPNPKDNCDELGTGAKGASRTQSCTRPATQADKDRARRREEHQASTTRWRTSQFLYILVGVLGCNILVWSFACARIRRANKMARERENEVSGTATLEIMVELPSGEYAVATSPRASCDNRGASRTPGETAVDAPASTAAVDVDEVGVEVAQVGSGERNQITARAGGATVPVRRAASDAQSSTSHQELQAYDGGVERIQE